MAIMAISKPLPISAALSAYSLPSMVTVTVLFAITVNSLKPSGLTKVMVLTMPLSVFVSAS